MNRASVFEWHKRFKEGRESVRDDERCGKSKEVRTPELIGQIKNFMDKDRRVSTETISAQFDVRKPDQVNPPTNFWWSLFFDSTGMVYMHWVSLKQTVNKEYYVEVLREFKEFRKGFRRKMPALFKLSRWHFH